MNALYPQDWTLPQKLDLLLARRHKWSGLALAALAFTDLLLSVDIPRFYGLFVALDIVIIANNLPRYFLVKRIIESKSYLPTAIKMLKVSFVINACAWSLLASIILFDSQMQGERAFLGLLICAGFTVSGLVSLVPSKPLGIFWLTVFILPIAATSAWSSFAANSSGGYQIALLALLMLGYCYKQFIDLHADLLVSIVHAESLANSNLSLLESRRQLSIETEKSVHAARLASVGEMASGLSHEINNPLMIIQGHSDSIGQILETLSTSEQKEKLSDRNLKIQAAITRISQIIRGLRLFSSEGESLPFDVKNVGELIRDTLDLCREKFKNNGVVLRLKIDEDIFVSCRAVQLSQVLIGLLNNSYDAVRAAPVKWIEIEAFASTQRVHILVRDSGAGVPKTDQEKIFQPFFTSKDTGAGTGLGLSIAKGIMKGHGGEINLLPGEAVTTFLVSLPIAVLELASVDIT